MESHQLHAGLATSDITTNDPTVNVHDRLLAKVMVLDDGRTRIVLIAMDAVAIGGICEINDAFRPALAQRIERELGIRSDHVLVHATHTHPPGKLLCGHDQQLRHTFDAVAQATRNLVPVTVGVDRGHEDRIAINRTLRLDDGTGWTIRQTNPCPPDRHVTGLGPLDSQVGVIRLDRLDGSPLAVIYNYACHPLIGVPGGAVTANYPGFASRWIEQHLGCEMAMFLQGACGDVTEVLYKDVHRPRDSEPLGAMLGQTVLSVARQISTCPGIVRIVAQTVDFPRRTDLAQRIDVLEQEQAELLESLRFTSLNFKSFLPLFMKHMLDPDHPGDHVYRYLHEAARGDGALKTMDRENRQHLEKYVRNIETMERLARNVDKIATLKRHQAINDAAGGATIRGLIQAIAIRDAVLLTAPFEVLTETGMAIKQASPYEHTYLACFSNGYLHYGPEPADYDRGGYEATECFLAPQWQDVFMRVSLDLLQKV